MYVKMRPASQKPGLQPARNAPFAKLPLFPPRHDDRLFAHAQTVICSAVFIDKVVPRVVHDVHLHILDRIQAQTCTEVGSLGGGPYRDRS